MHIDIDDEWRAIGSGLEIFIAAASPEELLRLHMLLGARHSLLLGLAIPRTMLPHDVRLELEKVCNALEEAFVNIAPVLRSSESFRLLSLMDRRQFERCVLTLRFED